MGGPLAASADSSEEAGAPGATFDAASLLAKVTWVVLECERLAEEATRAADQARRALIEIKLGLDPDD